MHMRKLAYSINADDRARRTGVGNHEIVSHINTRDTQVETSMNEEGEITIEVSAIEVTGVYTTRQVMLLRRMRYAADGRFISGYVNPEVYHPSEVGEGAHYVP